MGAGEICEGEDGWAKYIVPLSRVGVLGYSEAEEEEGENLAPNNGLT